MERKFRRGFSALLLSGFMSSACAEAVSQYESPTPTVGERNGQTSDNDAFNGQVLSPDPITLSPTPFPADVETLDKSHVPEFLPENRQAEPESTIEDSDSLFLNEKVSDILSRIEPLFFDSKGNLVILDEAEDMIAKPVVVIPTNESQERAKKGELVNEVRILVVHSDGASRLKYSGEPRTVFSTLAGLNSSGASTHWSIDEFPIRLEHEGEGGFGILSTQAASGDANKPYEGTHVLIGIEIKTGRPDLTRINTVDIFENLGIESNLIDLVSNGITDMDRYSVGYEQIGWYLSRNFPENIPPNQQIANVLSLTLANMEQYGLTPWDIVGHHEIQEKSDPGDEFMAILRFLIGVAALEGKTSRDLVFKGNESDVEYFLLVGDYLRKRVSEERFAKWEEYVGYGELIRQLGDYE